MLKYLLIAILFIAGCTEYHYHYDKETNIQVDPQAEVSSEDMQTLKKIMHKYNVSTVIYYGVDTSTGMLTPPSIRELLTEQEYKITINFADNFGDTVTIESHKNNIENVFKYAEEYMQAFGIKPKLIFYFVEPQNVNLNVKAFELTEQLMNSL